MTIAQNSNLKDALEHCRLVTRSQARNFYHGLKLTPEPKRSALYAIYAWMRKADDLVDHATESNASLRAKVERFRVATDAALDGNPVDGDPVWISLHDVVRRFDLDRKHFLSMIDGQYEDLGTKRYETFDQLRRYCNRVASTVGLICISIWGYEGDRVEQLAIDRGLAFQLTNIIRDIREDFGMGRVYLPMEDFERHELTCEQLLAWDPPEACRRMILSQIERAESYYTKSEPLDACIDASCAPALWAMTAIYRGTLDKIRHDPETIGSDARVSLSSLQKGAIVLQAKWRSLRSRTP